ncbi:hypothetical protein FOZ63_032577 [Perkinsus olseni]|uniref:Uncharacterized protein n=1 Tax=Perkinsus olseni TaxID=32597 RepID=A0A7J6RIY8_PEROL|nr:hypothetical protein FOZ63_032577 [Perkinsus olseni]
MSLQFMSSVNAAVATTATSAHPSAYTRFLNHKEAALAHEKNNEWRLAVFEWRECFRIRPRDEEVSDKLREAESRLQGPDRVVIPLRKIIGHFNLAIRYWDAGKASLALSESYLAGELLEKYGLPLGCALHNMHAIETVSASFKEKDQETQENVDRRPHSVKYSYERAVLLFDKRQLTAAYEQLSKCKELTEWKRKVKHISRPKEDPLMERYFVARLGLRTTFPTDAEQGAGLLTGSGASSARSLGQRSGSSCEQEIRGIEDDILCVKELIALYQQSSDSQRSSKGKGGTPQILPCLLCRFEGSLDTDEDLEPSVARSTAVDDTNTVYSAAPLDECTAWWETLCACDESSQLSG